MTAPVTVTAADYALLQALDVPASADNLLVAAFHRQQAEAASNAQVAELREAVERHMKWLNNLPIPTTGCTAQMIELTAAIKRAKSASEAEGV